MLGIINGGEVCHCLEDSSTANQKTKDGWQQINCDKFNCQHRQKNEYGKSACNRIAWLKFLIPNISKDRIFLMRITGQTSISRLKDYFNLQKSQGNSIQGNYTLYLKQEEQSNFSGKTFNNYILDILKKDDFISENTTSPQNENDKNVNTKVEKEQISSVKQPVTNNADSSKEQKEKTTTKKTTAKSKKETESKASTEQKSSASNKTAPKEKENVENYYALLNTSTEKITDKYGNPKDYLIGEFADSKDKITNIVIRPEDAEELKNCDLGTFVRLDIAEIGNRKFAMKLEFIEKCLKKVVA